MLDVSVFSILLFSSGNLVVTEVPRRHEVVVTDSDTSRGMVMTEDGQLVVTDQEEMTYGPGLSLLAGHLQLGDGEVPPDPARELHQETCGVRVHLAMLYTCNLHLPARGRR